MKTIRNIFIAFILNLSFAVFEFIGGILTGSVAIFSDAIHDIGDALSIGISLILEKKSKKKPNEIYTFGYARYSVIGSLFTTIVLLIGSGLMIYESIKRIINPVEINYNKMIIFAVIGVVVNFLAALFTHEGKSVNQKAVNLHMLEDVLGWIVVLIGSIIMRFTDISILDPIMSIGVALFILIATIKNLFETLNLFLEKTPKEINYNEIKEHLLEIDGINDIHHLHIWTLDGITNLCTLHVVTDNEPSIIKKQIREELSEHSIIHSTIEIEKTTDECDEKDCHLNENVSIEHHHHHHH